MAAIHVRRFFVKTTKKKKIKKYRQATKFSTIYYKWVSWGISKKRREREGYLGIASRYDGVLR
jgi:hypothetical protein